MLLHGEGVRTNPAEAQRFFKRAFEAGSATAVRPACAGMVRVWW
jgi:TPR repeat protein